MNKTFRVLHIEDDPIDARIMKDCLVATGKSVEVLHCGTLNDGLSELRKDSCDVVLVDLSLPDSNGRDLLAQIKAETVQPVIVVTGNIDQTQAESYVELGADDYLFKNDLTPSVIWKSIVYSISNNNSRKKLQQQAQDLILASELERRANSSKTEFLAKVSHELRTPLGAILGFTELIDNEVDLNSDARGYVTRIRKNGQLLIELVNDLLDFSRIESGHLDPVFKEIDLIAELEDLTANFNFHADRKKIRFNCEFPTPLARFAINDQLRFKQILNNLLSNALKFTEEGFITLTVNSEITDTEQILTLDVKDTGAGISEGDRKRIFEPFQQGDHRTRQRFDGAGIGLALSSRLANALGGSLVLLDSTPGAGSTFRLTIPLKKPERAWDVIDNPTAAIRGFPHKVQETATVHRWDGVRVLLAEDNQDNQILISRYLTKLGFITDTAENGKVAVDKALAGNHDLVLMDMQMPIMSGYEAVSKLRFHGYMKPVIALTAFVTSTERGKCMEAGCNGFISKPVTISSLAEGIHGIVPTPMTAADSTESLLEEDDDEWLSDPDLLEIRKQFLTNLPGYIRSIMSIALKSDWDQLAMEAHTLRGTSANFGLQKLSSVCKKLETLARSTPNPDVIAETVHKLQLTFREATDSHRSL